MLFYVLLYESYIDCILLREHGLVVNGGWAGGHQQLASFDTPEP